MTPDSLARLSGWSDPKGRLRGAVLVGLTMLTFWFLFRKIDLGAVLGLIGAVPIATWLVALLLTLSFPLLSALRWQLTLRAIGHRLPLRRCLAIILGVSPISALAPSKAGDLLKAASLHGEVNLLEVGGGVLAERALDVATLALFALVGGLLGGSPLAARVGAVVLALCVIALVLLPAVAASIPKPRLREKLQRTLLVLGGLKRQPGLAALVLLYTAANWGATLLQTHLLLRAVGAEVHFLLTMSAVPLAIFVGLLPITIGGMGTRDAALVTLLAPAATSAHALSVGLLYSFFGYWLPALIGIPFLSAALPSFARARVREAPAPSGPSREPARACKICGGTATPRHVREEVAYFYCPACDFLQNYYWEDHPEALAERRTTNERGLETQWQPGNLQHERAKAHEIIGLMTSPIAWTSRRLHKRLTSFPWYDRWYRAQGRRRLRTVLDFGCGHGATTTALRSEGIACTGIDPFVTTESDAVLRATVHDPRLPPGSFDGIVATEALEHVSDVVETFRALQGLLRPGGVLLAQTRRLEDPAYRAEGAEWFYLDEPRQHVAIYSRRAFQKLAALAGFRSVRFRGTKFARFVK